MKLGHLRQAATLLAGLTLATAGAAHAAVLQGVDFTARDGTSYASINTTPVRVDFGPGAGLGSLSVASINGGSYVPIVAQPRATAPGPYVLGNGDRLVTSNEVIFGPQSRDGELRGFALTFALDAGSQFRAGDVFVARSLDANGTYFQPGSSLSGPDSASLPSDGRAVLYQVSSDSNGPIYSSDGVSEGRAFFLLQDTASFTVNFLARNGSQGVAFQFYNSPDAVAQVPEPATLGLLAAGLAGCIRSRRRESGRS